MKHVLGVELDNGRLWQIKRSVFRNMAKNYFDLTKLSQFRFDKLDGRVTIEGWHHLVEAVANARGTIIATAHLGNFELAAQLLALRGIEMTIFVEDFNGKPCPPYTFGGHMLEACTTRRHKSGFRAGAKART